jgi:hypothetical protein
MSANSFYEITIERFTSICSKTAGRKPANIVIYRAGNIVAWRKLWYLFDQHEAVYELSWLSLNNINNFS